MHEIIQNKLPIKVILIVGDGCSVQDAYNEAEKFGYKIVTNAFRQKDYDYKSSNMLLWLERMGADMFFFFDKKSITNTFEQTFQKFKV